MLSSLQHFSLPASACTAHLVWYKHTGQGHDAVLVCLDQLWCYIQFAFVAHHRITYCAGRAASRRVALPGREGSKQEAHFCCAARTASRGVWDACAGLSSFVCMAVVCMAVVCMAG